MLIEMRGRSQITIPKEITNKLNLKEGDKFELIEKDGGIFLCPVIVCKKEKLDSLAKKIKKIEKETSKKSYSNIDKMFRDMGINIE